MVKKSKDTDHKEIVRKRYKSYLWTDPKTNYLYARVRVKLPNGKSKAIYKRAKNKTHALQLAEDILSEYDARGDAFVEGREMTFADAAKWYAEKYVVPPVYNAQGQKIGGMRSWKSERNKIERLILFFGQMKIAGISEKTLNYFSEVRKSEGVKISTLNRDLETVRAMLNKFKRKRWISESPFDFGDTQIAKSLENRRTVTLTDEEEAALLYFAKKSKQNLIYPLILVLRDSGARPSEIYPVNEDAESGVLYSPVCWRDFFDYNFKAVHLTSYKGSQVKTRFAPVTTRTESALMELWQSIPAAARNLRDKIFPHKSYKTSWSKVRKDAELFLRIARHLKVPVSSLFDNLPEEKIEDYKAIFKKEDTLASKKKQPVFRFDVRLRDLRRDFRTRLARAGYSDQLAQRLLGHESPDTTFIYTEADLASVYLANDALNKEIEMSAVIESKLIN